MKLQPLREIFSLLSVVFLVIAYVVATGAEVVVILGEAALVFSILSESYAQD